ncbi:MAG: hypothetical protein JOY96_00960 [Verrucomicrobia bacterium]|nr:hypothetical protein [Verrucomicrobiota bacterium]
MKKARLAGWAILYLGASFCWIVLIEHGPENFLDGIRIELENLFPASDALASSR